MIRRCTDANWKDWPRYGGRGIAVSERWHRFDGFLADMGYVPEGLTLDRIDNDGNYEPGNCRWATWAVQRANRRPNYGEMHGNAKLTDADVWAIRLLARLAVTQRNIATLFGVSHANVGYIVRREAWKHVPDVLEATNDAGEVVL